SCDPAHIPLIPEETDISIQNVLFRATVFCEEPFFLRLELRACLSPGLQSRSPPWTAAVDAV
ncbi:hypothetical protein, partial [Cupriavidus necator]|uniref:hypothetical protein n=1 Tax=Cupriavidus necator TaxID=106590 RepID=UPI00339D4251